MIAFHQPDHAVSQHYRALLGRLLAEQPAAGGRALLRIQARTTGLRQVDRVVHRAACHLGAEVIKGLGQGHAAALRQIKAVCQPIGVGASVAALRTRKLLRRRDAGLLPAQGVGVFIAGEVRDGVLQGGDTV